MLTQIHLINYRNYPKLKLALSPSMTAITGHNGAGKTNILEAISLLSPGKGLRGADNKDICKNNALDWGVNYQINDQNIAIGSPQDSRKKIVRINEKDVSHTQLSHMLSVFWLTPEQDSLFRGSSSDRRKFFDRLAFGYHPNHASLINKYEKLMRERNKLLEEDNQPKWLEIIEDNIAATGVEITHNRLSLLEKISKHLEIYEGNFPKARIELINNDEVEKEGFLRNLYNSRPRDRQAGRMLYGCHRSDFAVYYEAKNEPAANCSTGEQKALLLSISICNIMAKKEYSELPLILLLDEVTAHLDENRKNELFNFLHGCQVQCLMSGTHREFFSHEEIMHIEVREGNIIHQK